MSASGGWRPRHDDVGLAAAAGLFGVGDSLTNPWNALLGQNHLGAAVVTGLGGLLLLGRRRWPTAVAGGCALVNMVAFAPVGLLLGLYAAGAYSRTVARVAGVCVFMLGTQIVTSDFYPDGSPARNLLWGVFYLGAAGIGLQSRRYTAAVRDRATALLRERTQIVERARAEERSKVAGEMHDVVAHRVSLMVVEAGALEVSAERGPEWAVEVARRIRLSGHAALTELRQIVGVLRPADAVQAPLTPQQGMHEISPMVESFRRAGLEVSVSVVGASRELTPAIGGAMYRVAEESLTNVLKHGGGAMAWVTIRFRPACLLVRVVNGPGPEPAPRDRGGWSGAGLAALSERVSMLGGTFSAWRRPDGGFEVMAVLPLDEEVTDD